MNKEREKILALFVGVCMVLTLAMPAVIVTADATSIEIEAPNPTGNPVIDWANLQAALDSMGPGDTLYLKEGRYAIYKPLVTHGFHGSIIGEGMDETYIDAVPGPLGYFEVAYMSEYDGYSAPGSEDYLTDMLYFGSPESVYVEGFTLEVSAPGIAEMCYTIFPETEEDPEFTAYWYDVGPQILSCIDVSFAMDCDTTFENVGIKGVYPDAVSPRFGLVHWESVGGTHTVEDCVFENTGIFACGPFWCHDATYVFKSNVIDTSFRGFQSAVSSGMDIRVMYNDIYHTDFAGIMNFFLDSSIMKVAHNNLVDVDGGFWYITNPFRVFEGSKYLVEHNYIELRYNTWTGAIETWDYAEAKSDLVVISNKIHSENATAPYGPVCLNGMQDAIVAFNKITGYGPAAMYIGVWEPNDGIVLLGNNVQNFDVTDGNWEPPGIGDPLEGVGRIWLGEFSSNCLVVGGSNKKNVVNEGLDNIVVGVDHIGWLTLGQIISDAVHRIIDMKSLFY